jgi:hypothetical protein
MFCVASNIFLELKSLIIVTQVDSRVKVISIVSTSSKEYVLIFSPYYKSVMVVLVSAAFLYCLPLL